MSTKEWYSCYFCQKSWLMTDDVVHKEYFCPHCGKSQISPSGFETSVIQGDDSETERHSIQKKPKEKSKYHILFSAEDSPYQNWQSELLAFSFARTHPDFSFNYLTRLLSVSSQTLAGFWREQNNLQSYNVESVARGSDGDYYPPYNKPAALQRYCQQWGAENDPETIYLLVDPDMIFVRTWFPELSHGDPVAEDTWYMNTALPKCRQVVQRHCRRHPEKIQAVGFPVILTHRDLLVIVDRWDELTCQLRQDAATRRAVDWVCEMWAFTIAAAENGLHFDVQRNSCYTTDNYKNEYLIHYTYATKGHRFHWDKRQYTAWTELQKIDSDVPSAGCMFYEILNEAAAKFRRDPKSQPWKFCLSSGQSGI